MADSEKRIRTHTEQGVEMYETTRDKYIISLEDSWKRVDNSMNTALQKSEQKQKDISNTRKELSRQYEIFCKISEEVKDFIVRTNTAQSKEDFDKLGLTIDQRVKAVNDTFANIDAIERSLLESASHQSVKIKKKSKSRSTTGSSVRVAPTKCLEEEQKLINAKANASLERKKVETKANIKLLQHQKEAEVAEAEYRVLESEIDTESDESDLTPEKLKLNGKIDPAERTAIFLSQQSQLKDTNNIEEKDLLLSRLTVFNDKPESSCSWKACFKRIMSELEVNPSEELDLLVKNLGSESSSACKEKIVCGECESDSHPSALHLVKQGNPTKNGEENHTPEVSSICTKVCGGDFNGMSCSKTILAKVYKQNPPDKAIMAYIILDDQSNRSLTRPELFSLLHLKGHSSEYKLTSCAGTMNTFGRRATGLVIESLDAVVLHHDHLQEIADYIPEIDETAPIVLLIGRDLLEAHHVIEQLKGPTYSPYAQKLSLGWVIVGETCLNQFHRPDTVTVNKTYLLRNGRSSICKPCPNNIEIKENLSADSFVTSPIQSQKYSQGRMMMIPLECQSKIGNF
ncbi:Hypothetical predicted protein [Mytilus galloprovincialis]|uniref:Peptidase aspartic putative domain-containing protein n=1 Tax=Mytilus galloprovincialis TaxID=29158 RepID=A0A8B6CHU7_MYTGA|nr:Hypothetical predicted protein [Mytilus galloprovincialis]